MEGTIVPRVSVVMPTHNRAGLLSRAIESIRRQAFADWELVVTDDASTDGTWAVLTEWAAKDGRIRPYRNAVNQYPDISKILNDGLARARGEYIARLDDDDHWIDTDKLKRQVAYLDAHPDCVIVGTGVVVMDGEGRERYRYLKSETDAAIRESALLSNPFTHSAVLYRKAVALECGGYERQYAEDWTLWLSMGKKGKLHNIPEYSTGFLMAGQNKSWVHERAHAKTLVGIVVRFRRDYPHFFRAYAVNLAALVFAYMPAFVRSVLYPLASRVKRIL
jgi:glycosyltransferase involved in cell wall biosynthesis